MNDKVAIVTGGSSGMGLAISQELKSKGIKVIIFIYKDHQKVLTTIV